MFCPECGKALTQTGDEDSTTPIDDAGNAPGVSLPEVVRPTADDQATLASDQDQSKAPVIEDRQSARERTRETLRRASKMTRGAIEDNVKRVEKVHHASSVVLEEATYDPSLRFVLVALGLFVLAVILLVLSKVMG